MLFTFLVLIILLSSFKVSTVLPSKFTFCEWIISLFNAIKIMLKWTSGLFLLKSKVKTKKQEGIFLQKHCLTVKMKQKRGLMELKISYTYWFSFQKKEGLFNNEKVMTNVFRNLINHFLWHDRPFFDYSLFHTNVYMYIHLINFIRSSQGQQYKWKIGHNKKTKKNEELKPHLLG